MAQVGKAPELDHAQVPFSGVLVVLSIVSNLLMLTGPLFMLQVYDRVLVSRSVPTLMALVGLVLGLYAFYAIIEWLRARIALRLALGFDAMLTTSLFEATVRRQFSTDDHGGEIDPIRDSDTVRNFLTSPAPLALLDLPWVPIYLALVFAFHPLLGWLAAGGGTLLCLLMIGNEALLRRPSAALTTANVDRQQFLEDARTNAEAIVGMGMFGDLGALWTVKTRAVLNAQRRGGDWTALFSSATKAVRFLLQSLVLGLGAFLVIRGEMTGGLIIAASVVTSRAVAPVEQVVAYWRGLIASRAALKRIKSITVTPVSSRTAIASPRESLQVRQLSCGPPHGDTPTLRAVNFQLRAGEALGVLGPSGSGKTSLAKALVGVWPASRGEIRLDGALLEHYEPEALGRYIGYLPQRVDLFEGKIADNIARFRADATSQQILAAANAAGVHELINSLPNGYDTLVGTRGGNLSAGQQQRIGLARALFGNPFLVVLDEPNSNLDPEGETALTAAIHSVRDRGGIVVVIAHRPAAVIGVNRLLLLRNGGQAAFGAKSDVLASHATRREHAVTAEAS